MEKIIANTATKISLNDRFTIFSKAKPKTEPGTARKARLAPRRSAANTGAGTLRNRRFVENLEKKLKFRAALKLKNKSIRGGRIQRKTVVGTVAANRLRRTAVKKRLTMAADQLQNVGGRRGRRGRSASVSSVHSRLGVSRRVGGNVVAKTAGTRRRLQRSNSVAKLQRSASNGNLARGRSRSRSRSRANNNNNNLQRVNSNANVSRNRSRSRSRVNVAANNGQARRRLNRTNLRRANSKGNLSASGKGGRLGINRNSNAINARRNRRRAIAGPQQPAGKNQANRGVRNRGRGNQQQQQRNNNNNNQNNNSGGRGRSRNRGGPAGNQQTRGRSRTRRNDKQKPQQSKEQLDRELDLYMAKSKNSAQSELDIYMSGSTY